MGDANNGIGGGMTKSKYAIMAALCFSSGVLAASQLSIGREYACVILALCAVVLALAVYRDVYAVAIVAWAVLFVMLGVLRLEGSMQSNMYEGLFDSKIKLEGHIVAEPDVRSGMQMLTVKPVDYDQKILVTTTDYSRYDYGDWIVIEGKLKEAKNFSDFDYKGYLERYNIYAVMQYPKILVLKDGQGNPVMERILALKAWFVERAKRMVPEPQDALLLGILVGSKKQLSPEVSDYFARTGVSHIVAVSGYNISVIIVALSGLALYIGRRLSFLVSVLVIVAFVLLTGASASVVRAGVMGFLLLVALNVGRQYNVLPSLILAGGAMIAHNPKILYWDIGFQLSFAATLGIVMFMPQLERLTGHWPNPLQFKTIALTTIVATIATLPLVLLHFSRFSVVALVANMLILPVIPYAMLTGFLILIPVLAPGIALVANILLAYIIFVAKALSGLPFASVEWNIGQWGFLALCSMVFGFYWVVRKAALGKPLPVETQHILW